MSLIVPSVLEGEVLTSILTPALHLRLFSNNVVPAHSSSAASFTEVVGAGYAALPLTFANWTLTIVDPSQANYNTIQTFNFTGPTNAPGTIFGYFITRDSDGKLMWAEQFPAANIPFIPINGSKIQISPRFAAFSQF